MSIIVLGHFHFSLQINTIFFYFQIVRDCLEHGGVNLALLPASLDITPTSASMYTLQRRYTADQLRRKFAAEGKHAQEEYLRILYEVTDKFGLNITCAEAMDKTLGEASIESMSSDDDSFSTTPDFVDSDSPRLVCPVLPCRVTTVKLRRHLESVHNLSPEQTHFALDKAKLIRRNRYRGNQTSDTHSTASPRPRPYQNTALVNKKLNYKACSLCKRLVMNMTNHIRKTHQIQKSDSRYDSLIHHCEVVPKCYTKQEGGTTVRLVGSELKDAQAKFSKQVVSETDTLAELKSLRSDIEQLKSDIATANDTNRGQLEAKLSAAYETYKDLRYADTRNYSTTSKKWKVSFQNHLARREHHDPKRGAAMAMDVLLPFEVKLDRELTMEDLLHPKLIRDMLELFSQTTNTRAGSKLKYLTMFEMLLKSLAIDCESPEHREDATTEDMLSKDVRLKAIQHEIVSFRILLSKRRGAESIASKSRAKEKLVSEEELQCVMTDAQKTLISTVAAVERDETAWTPDCAIKVRDALIAIGTVRLGRRSKELIRMSLDEVNKAEQRTVNNEPFYIIHVTEQKNAKTGEAAPWRSPKTNIRLCSFSYRISDQKLLQILAAMWPFLRRIPLSIR